MNTFTKVFLIIALVIVGGACEELQEAVNEPPTQPGTQPDGELTGLQAPAGLTATAGDLHVRLTWTPSSDTLVTEYKIRYTVDGNTTDIAVDGRSTASHTVTGLTAGKSYSFTIAAVGGRSESAQSTAVTATPLDMNVSVVFRNVAGDAYVVSQALLAEGDPAFNSQEAVAKYNKLPANTTLTNGQTHKITVKCDKVMSVGAIGVTRGVGGTVTAHYWPADGSTTGKGKTHTFVCGKETTINFGANGSVTFALSQQPVTPRTDSMSGPAAPAAAPEVTAEPADGQVTLSWQAVSGATSYKVFQGTNDNEVQNIAEGTVTAVITGLTNDTAYSFWVAAVNSGGTTLSAEVTATPRGQ